MGQLRRERHRGLYRIPCVKWPRPPVRQGSVASRHSHCQVYLGSKRLQESEGAVRKQGCAIFDTIFVEGDLGVVEEVGVVLRGFGAEEIELSGHLVSIEREVFAHEVGKAWDDVLLAEVFCLYRRQSFVDAGVVEQVRIVGAEVEFDGAMELCFELLEQGVHAGDDLVIEIIVLSAHGTLQQYLGWDHVEARRSETFEVGDGEYGGRRIGLRSYERMGAGDDPGGNGYRVDDMFHRAGMATFAGDADGEIADIGEGFTVLVPEDADG